MMPAAGDSQRQPISTVSTTAAAPLKAATVSPPLWASWVSAVAAAASDVNIGMCSVSMYVNVLWSVPRIRPRLP